MHILCPQCQSPVEVVKLTPWEEIDCQSCGSSFRLEDGASTTADSRAGQTIGKFQVQQTLGQGSFGTVYKARDPELDRIVAVKVPRAGNLSGPKELDRFLREARSVAQLRHPSIIAVHEVGQQDGLPYLVSEFVKGVTLADLLSARRPGFRESAELVVAVAGALQYAHEQGVVHRDVKPSNIMIGEDGKPFVMDFGLAKRETGETTMTVEGQVLGTPAYMPPEQASGEGHAVDARGDVYSLGVVLYQLLTGELPFRGTARMLLHQVLHDDPRPLRRLNDSIPRDLETICLKCLRKEPGKRYESAAALADDLRRFLAEQPILARPVGRWERAVKWVRRNPALAAMTVVVVLVLLAGTGISTAFGIHAHYEAEQATMNEADAVAKGKELVIANDDLKRSRDELETALIRSWLRPLALENSFASVSDHEWEAIWELATNRRGRLGYRFIEEASRTPVASRQLRNRAALALTAAVGLDADRRAEIEALLIARLDDAAFSDEQKTDLALAASGWDDLSSAGAGRMARHLSRVIKDGATSSNWWASPEYGLSNLSARMEATEAANILVQAMKDSKDPNSLNQMASSLSSVAERLDARAAADNATQAAAILLQAMKDTKDPADLSPLASGLSSVAERLDAKAVAALAAQAAAVFLQAMKDTKDPRVLGDLGRSLASVAERLEPKAATTVATQATILFLQPMKDSKDPYSLYSLATGLLSFGKCVEVKEATAYATQATSLLLQAMKDSKDPNGLYWLATGLSAVAERLEARTAAALAAQAAAILLQAMKDTKDPRGLGDLARSLASVAERLEPRAATAVATQAANILVKAIKDTKDPSILSSLRSSLSELAIRIEASEATRLATTLTQAMKDIKNVNSLYLLAWGLPALLDRMEARDAATILDQTMKQTQDQLALSVLALAQARFVGHMKVKDVFQTATILVQAPQSIGDSNDQYYLVQVLSALLSDLPFGEIPTRSATVASAVAISGGSGPQFTALAMLIPVSDPFPSSLTTPQLIELLKMPTCLSPCRRVILDQLGNRYHRTFGDVWEFVRFSKEQNLDLDFTSPPQRPQLDTSAKSAPK